MLLGAAQQEEELEKEKLARAEKRAKALTHNSSQMVVDEVRPSDGAGAWQQRQRSRSDARRQ